jgi:peptidoglycan/xylan/chitin deacetylase (PgdA/CDA1 family)
VLSLRNIRSAAKRAVARARRGKARRQLSGHGLAILMLHKVTAPADELNLAVRPEWFSRILDEVAAVGPVLDLGDPELVAKVAANDGVCFAITFDDGYRDNFLEAWPRLKQRSLPATIFLSVDHVRGARSFWYERLAHCVRHLPAGPLSLARWGLGTFVVPYEVERRALRLELDHALKQLSDETRESCLSALEPPQAVGMTAPQISPMLRWDEIRQMSPDIRFGSHTVSHCILSRESRSRVREELRESRRIIAEETGGDVRLFAYPNGRPVDYSPEVIDEVRDAGYRLAVTTSPGIVREFGRPFELTRCNVYDGMCSDGAGGFSRDLFWAKLCNVL